jgi:hypothetical protein
VTEAERERIYFWLAVVGLVGAPWVVDGLLAANVGRVLAARLRDVGGGVLVG